MVMTVSAAAQAAGVSIKAIRLWEAKGLVPPVPRTEAGYRLFTEDDVELLRFIRHAKLLNFSLDEIREILDMRRGYCAPCGRVAAILDAHIAKVDHAIMELHRRRRWLADALATAQECNHQSEDRVVGQIIKKAAAPN